MSGVFARQVGWHSVLPRMPSKWPQLVAHIFFFHHDGSGILTHGRNVCQAWHFGVWQCCNFVSSLAWVGMTCLGTASLDQDSKKIGKDISTDVWHCVPDPEAVMWILHRYHDEHCIWRNPASLKTFSGLQWAGAHALCMVFADCHCWCHIYTWSLRSLCAEQKLVQSRVHHEQIGQRSVLAININHRWMPWSPTRYDVSSGFEALSSYLPASISRRSNGPTKKTLLRGKLSYSFIWW